MHDIQMYINKDNVSWLIVEQNKIDCAGVHPKPNDEIYYDVNETITGHERKIEKQGKWEDNIYNMLENKKFLHE